MRSIGLATRVVQLIDGNDVDYKTGAMIYRTDDVYNFVDGRPYSWTLAGDGRYFDVAAVAHEVYGAIGFALSKAT